MDHGWEDDALFCALSQQICYAIGASNTLLILIAVGARMYLLYSFDASEWTILE